MRVACRRGRAAIGFFRCGLGDDWRSLNDELRWLGSALGAVRDPETQTERLEQAVESGDVGPAAAAWLRQVLSDRRDQGRSKLIEGLDSERYAALVDDWRRCLDSASGPAAPLPASAVLPAIVRKALRRVARFASALGDTPADDKLHALRIRVKKLRYACEFAAPVYGKPAKDLAKLAAKAQDVLGAHQDAVVGLRLLDELAPGATNEAACAEIRCAYLSRAAERRSEFGAAIKKLEGPIWRRLRREMARRLRYAWKEWRPVTDGGRAR